MSAPPIKQKKKRIQDLVKLSYNLYVRYIKSFWGFKNMRNNV